MTRIIVVTVSPMGETKLETQGFMGNACREASRSIEQALGIRTSEQISAEFYERPSLPQREDNPA